MILYRWVLDPAALPALLADGWRIVAEHPCFSGRGVLLRKEAPNMGLDIAPPPR